MPTTDAGTAGGSSGAPASFGVGRALRYAAGNVGAGMVWAFAAAALPFYLAGYGLPNSLVGLLSQPRPPVAGILQIVVGRASDRTRTRYGRRRPYLLVGAPLAVGALAALGWHPPLALTLVLLVTAMSCLAVAYAPYLALLPDLVPEGEQSRVQGLLTVGNMLGQLLALALAMRLWTEHESAVFWLVAAGLLVGFAVTIFGVRERPAAPAAAETPNPSLGQYLREIASQTALVRYLVASGLFWLGMGAVLPFLTRFAVAELGLDEPTAFGLLMLIIGVTALAAVPAGWLGDRVGKRPALSAGLLVMATALVAGSQARTLPEVVAALVVAGLGNALCTVTLYPLLAGLIPAGRAGEFTGIGYGLWEAVQPAGALLAGLAIDATGSLRSAVALAGLILFASAVALRHVPATGSPRPAPVSPAGEPAAPRA